MGLSELLILVSLVAVPVVIAVALVSRSRQRSVGSGATPSLPPKREAAPAKAAGDHQVVAARAGIELGAQLREHAAAAELRGLRPFLEVGAAWCPPSRMFGEILDDPRMQSALAGVYLIRAEMDEFSGDAALAALGVRSVPVFFELDAEGSATGRQINGGAWGEDTIENMSRTMGGFFAG